MNLAAASDPETRRPSGNRPLKLETLVRLRWLAIGGQTATVLVVHQGFNFPVPLGACFVLIGLSALVNVALLVRPGPAHRPFPRLAAGQLAFDSLQLGGLLFLTGGVANPFSLLLLAPVSVSASTLSGRATALLVALTAAIVSVITVVHYPLPGMAVPALYSVGLWFSLISGLVFIAAYTNRVAHEARQLSDALTVTELALYRQQHLSALDGLAAAAAHELGTPLATITLAAKEMRRDAQEGEAAEDLDLILEQTARCRAILGRLRNLQPGGTDFFDTVPIGDVLAELAKPHEALGKTVKITKNNYGGHEPILPRNVAILYGLGNLIENAIQFAEQTVSISAGWDEQRAVITITDDGPGFPPELLNRLGEPYLTTKGRDRIGSDLRNPDGAGGMGLGVFIAKTLLERTEAQLRFFNTKPGSHACVEVIWPRSAFAGDPALERA